jgi:hypothetical protein
MGCCDNGHKIVFFYVFEQATPIYEINLEAEHIVAYQEGLCAKGLIT